MAHMRRSLRVLGLAGGAALAAASLLIPAAPAAAPHALLVGSYHGIPGPYRTIQAAVAAAKPGDTILVGPGVYHEATTSEDGVLITTPGVRLRGMDRNGVILDGTLPTSPRPCSSDAAAQSPTPNGRNGIEVKANGVYVENLTVCNFLSSAGAENGNEVWWNGGDGSGKMGMSTYWGNYLTATSSFFAGSDAPMAQYGIFVSNAGGPGSVKQSYANNMGDSAFYVGACPDCNGVLDGVHAEHSALGYSGTNSGGHLSITNSEWDDNKAGIVPNSLNNDDAPPPQDGACPNGGTGPTGTHSCTVIENNFVHDNNDPNVPGSGIAGSAPVGTGIEVAGGRNDTVLSNRVEHNGAWGIVVHDFPDTETPPPISNCQGGTQVPGAVCYFPAFGNEVATNALRDNGFFGNPTNSDLAAATMAHDPGNCFHGNTDPNGVTSDPPDIQNPAVMGTCGVPNQGDTTVLVAELVCASSVFGTCPGVPGATYPRTTAVTMPAAPPQATMPDPCAGVPPNAWCGVTH